MKHMLRCMLMMTLVLAAGCGTMVGRGGKDGAT